MPNINESGISFSEFLRKAKLDAFNNAPRLDLARAAWRRDEDPESYGRRVNQQARQNRNKR